MLIHLQFCAPPHAEVKQKVGREGERNEEYRGKTRKVTGFFLQLPPVHNHDWH